MTRKTIKQATKQSRKNRGPAFGKIAADTGQRAQIRFRQRPKKRTKAPKFLVGRFLGKDWLYPIAREDVWQGGDQPRSTHSRKREGGRQHRRRARGGHAG